MLRILVLDDDPAVLTCYGKLLRRDGHHVETETAGEKALARLGEITPLDVVILDFRMPGMDGLTFLDALRRLGHAPEVILISAWANEQVRASAARMGVRTILEKPVDIGRLRLAIRQATPLARASGGGF